jgi:hypothetical protein
MENDQSDRIVELKRKIALLTQDEKRLQSVISSPFANADFRRLAQSDLKLTLERINVALDELGRLRIGQ